MKMYSAKAKKQPKLRIKKSGWKQTSRFFMLSPQAERYF